MFSDPETPTDCMVRVGRTEYWRLPQGRYSGRIHGNGDDQRERHETTNVQSLASFHFSTCTKINQTVYDSFSVRKAAKWAKAR